jgi:hypothetical protein
MTYRYDFDDCNFEGVGKLPLDPDVVFTPRPAVAGAAE